MDLFEPLQTNSFLRLEICMDWETYNVDLDESQPADTDVSFGDPLASDAEREADGKTRPKEPSKRKKRRETPDSKESSEFSGSPVVSSIRFIWNIAVTIVSCLS